MSFLIVSLFGEIIFYIVVIKLEVGRVPSQQISRLYTSSYSFGKFHDFSSQKWTILIFFQFTLLRIYHNESFTENHRIFLVHVYSRG
jgi:hypothetical protein